MVDLRPAVLADLDRLSDLCLRSKAVWGYDAAFMAACRAELTLQPIDLERTELQIAELGAMLLGVAQIGVCAQEGHLQKLFVEPGHLRSGVGRRLLVWAMTRARELGARRLVVEADPGAETFYRRYGAQVAGQAPSGSIPGRFLPRLVFDLSNDRDANGRFARACR